MKRDRHRGLGVASATPSPVQDAAPPQPGTTGTAIAARAQPRRATVRSAWAHARARTAPLPPPTEAEVARMIAEFQARGGQVTICHTAHALPIQNGAGRDAQRWTA